VARGARRRQRREFFSGHSAASPASAKERSVDGGKRSAASPATRGARRRRRQAERGVASGRACSPRCRRRGNNVGGIGEELRADGWSLFFSGDERSAASPAARGALVETALEERARSSERLHLKRERAVEEEAVLLQ
jgi:hypothetical protein